jgi:hypothetical protein
LVLLKSAFAVVSEVDVKVTKERSSFVSPAGVVPATVPTPVQRLSYRAT